jgi:hypothetical protein
MRSSDPAVAAVEMESSDVYEPAGAVAALTHISRVNAAEPKAVPGTMAGDASPALLRKMLPEGAAHGADGDGDALTEADGIRDAERDADTDAEEIVFPAQRARTS